VVLRNRPLGLSHLVGGKRGRVDKEDNSQELLMGAVFLCKDATHLAIVRLKV